MNDNKTTVLQLYLQTKSNADDTGAEKTLASIRRENIIHIISTHCTYIQFRCSLFTNSVYIQIL